MGVRRTWVCLYRMVFYLHNYCRCGLPTSVWFMARQGDAVANIACGYSWCRKRYDLYNDRMVGSGRNRNTVSWSGIPSFKILTICRI